MTGAHSVTRRRILQIAAGAAGLSLAGRPGSARAAPPGLTHQWRGVAMGARAAISICHPDAAHARRLLERCVAETRRLEDVLSLYRQGSAIVALNRRSALDHPPPDLVHLLSLARAFGAATGGAFDPTVQPLWTLYAGHFMGPDANRGGPDPRSIERVRALVDYRNMSVDIRRITLAHSGMAITLNGIAQGYITDRVADLLRNEGLDDVLVDLGEIRALGRHADGRPWTVGLETGPGEIAMDRFSIDNQAVATSAGGGTRFDQSGRHHHLFDPGTGESTHRYRAITVVAPTATTADALSTAFSSMATRAMQRVLSAYPDTSVRITRHTGEVVELGV